MSNIKFTNVSYTYPSGLKALDNVSLEINTGEKVALLGLNGSGKSTLLLHTNGLLTPQNGTVTVNDIPTTSKQIDTIRKSVGLVFQNPDDQLFMPTVWEDVAFGPRNMNLTYKEINERVNEALTITRCSDLASRAPFELSGGQKKMISIATVLSMTPEIIVLDEPTSGLDYEAVEQFLSIVTNLSQAIIMSTHDMEVAKKICDRAIILDKGRIIYDGSLSSANYPPKQQLE